MNANTFNQYIVNLRARWGISVVWLAIVFISVAFAIGAATKSVIQARKSTRNGESGFQDMTKWATRKEMDRRMKMGDGFDDLAATSVDLRSGLVRHTKRTGNESKLKVFVEALIPEFFTPDPAASSAVTMRLPNGTVDKRRRVNVFKPLSMTFPEAMGTYKCQFDEKVARQFLCERGIRNDGMVYEAITGTNFCTREMDRADCHIYKACVRKVVRDHYSVPVSGQPFKTLVGDGRRAALSDGMCL
jgi:hypothetical protein